MNGMQWIDAECVNVGDVGYLVETFNTSTGWTTLSLRDRPLRTNMSHEPRLYGWCGETNNRSRTARGVWLVVKTNGAGDRALVRKLHGEALKGHLERDGHPELYQEG